MIILTIAEADALTQEWVDAHVDFERAALSYSAYPRRRWNELVDYTPEYEWAWDKVMGDIWALVELDVTDFKPGENDWNAALQYESTLQYIKWFRQGHTPPPLFVVRHVDGDLVSLNHRRWLAAREAGIKSLLCYYSPTAEHGRPAWERKLCTWDKDIICTYRAKGGDCTDCPQRPNQFRN